MNISNVEDAEILDESTNVTPAVETPQETTAPTKAESLLDRLAKKTEKKTPGSNSTKTQGDYFWNASEDDFSDSPPAKKEAAKSTEEPQKTEQGDSGKKVLTKKDFENSGKNCTFLFETLAVGVGRYVLNKKFKAAFTADERQLLKAGLLDADPQTLKPELLKLVTRYETEENKKETCGKKLPFDDKETEIMEDSWTRVFEQKGIELPPEWAAIIISFSTLGKRAADIAFD